MAEKKKTAPKKETKKATKPETPEVTKTPEPAIAAPVVATHSAASPFAGKTVVLTGTLMTMKRADAQKMLSAAGALIGDSVNKQTNILIYGEKAGSKLAAARKLNIEVMTEAEMVAKLTSSGGASKETSAVAQKFAEAQAEEQKRMGGVRAIIDAANAEYLKLYGMTLPQMLLKYFTLFSKRPDVFVTNHNIGPAASSKLLLRWQTEAPPEWLALRAELGLVHFSWVFQAHKAERDQYSEGYRGGRIYLTEPERFRWWPPQDYQKDEGFKEDAVFDDFVNEGRALLSYNPDQKPTEATLIFDNTNDCVRHPLSGIFRYLQKGACAGFTWYWQMNPGEFTAELFGASLSKKTPPEEVEQLLQKQGLTAPEAKALRLWLGDSAVILLHQSLTPEGMTKAKTAEKFPGANKASNRDMDISMVERLASAGKPMTKKAWETACNAHKEFLASGGKGGSWQLLSVSGLPLCIYQGAKNTKGTQLVLRLKSIKGCNAQKADLSYADISGAFCEGVDFSGASFVGSVMTDSIFSNANFSGANLKNADFSGSRLVGANFQKADLTGADFEATDLTGADFTGAILKDAKFPGAVLDKVKI